MESTKICGKWKPVVAIVGADVCLAIMKLLLKKVLDEGINLLVLVTYRQIVATICIAPIAFVYERKTRPKMTVSILFILFVSAMLGATLTQYFFFLGIHYTSATFSCAFINMVPVITYILALPLGLEILGLGNKAGKAKVMGSIVCISGILILIFYKGVGLTNPYHRSHLSDTIDSSMHPGSTKKDDSWTLGSIALMGGSFCWASWFILQSKVVKIYPLYSGTAMITFLSTFQAAILCFALHGDISSWVLRGKMEIVTVLYGGLVSSGMCVVAISWCVEQRGPLFTAAFSPLIQIVVGSVDFLLLHRVLHLGSLLGSVIVVMGLYALLWGKNQETHDLIPKQIQVQTQSKKGEDETQQV